MNRREAIYNFVIIGAGVMVLPSCGQKDAATIALKNFTLTGEEEQLVRQLSAFILPKNGFPGGEKVDATAFTLMMVDDCYPPEKQQVFKEGLQKFDELAKKKYGNSFASCSDVEKKEWLTYLENKKDVPENVAKFYEATKRHTVQAFTSSKEYLTDVVKYKMVPGSNFKGCVPVKTV